MELGLGVGVRVIGLGLGVGVRIMGTDLFGTLYRVRGHFEPSHLIQILAIQLVQ